MNDTRILYPAQPMVPVTTNSNIKSNSANAKNNAVISNVNFKNILTKELTGVKFSQHAQQRLVSRNINLSESQIERLQSAVDKAEEKGSRESLVLMDNQLAFVVSVRNRTVITAMDGTSIKDNIFTNIDSTIVT